MKPRNVIKYSAQASAEAARDQGIGPEEFCLDPDDEADLNYRLGRKATPCELSRLESSIRKILRETTR